MAKKKKDKLLEALKYMPLEVYGLNSEELKDVVEAKKRILDSTLDEDYRKQLLEELLSVQYRETRNDFDIT